MSDLEDLINFGTLIDLRNEHPTSWKALAELQLDQEVGALQALAEALHWLRYGVTIHNSEGTPVWWGYVEGVEIVAGALWDRVSLQSMWNRVAVTYSYRDAGSGWGRATTAYGQDSDSVSRFGTKELVATLDTLVQQGRDAHLLMIGGVVGASDATNAAYLEAVRQQIAARGLERRVIWTGYLSQEQVSAAFAAADLCVLPYRDGISFRRGSLMAALAHGLPIVSTYPQMPLAEIEHGGNVWLVEAGKALALAEAVARLADDAALRQRLSQGARALARRFDWDAIAAETLRLLREVAVEARSGGLADGLADA